MNRYINNLLFGLIFTLIILLPDIISNFFWKNYYIYNSKNTLKEILITFIIGIIISFLPKKSKLLFSSLFLLFTFIQIGYFAYFHTYMPPYQLNLLFNEYKDIFDSLYSIVGIILTLIFIFIILLIILNLFSKRFKPKSNKYTLVLLLSLLIIFPFFVSKKREVYMPNASHFGYLNTFFSINLWIINNFSKKSYHNYKPYLVKRVDNGKPIVIMIMGESLNYKRLHLYGWDVNDTPKLDYLAAHDKNFQFKKAISGGVNTPVSIVTFFNIKRETQNINLIISQKTNILKLAKENNYKIYYYSMQEEGTSISSIMNYADIKKTRKDYKLKFDEEINKLLSDKKTFVILHFRVNHSPYEENTPKSFYKFNFYSNNYHIYRTHSYYDSVLYVDYLINQRINYMKAHYKNFVIYFTSDHGEMLGFKDEHGRYGHSQLVWGDTFVPFIYYSDTYHKNLTKPIYNHYMISKLLTRDLGYEIINPNDDNTYFVNGVNIDGSAGFIHYKINEKCNNKNILKCIKPIKKVTF